MRLLFLCTGNSCRSQMAEGFARHLLGPRAEVHSAGTAPKPLDPRAVKAMAEVGIDISRQRSKHVDELRSMRFDLVVTVCGQAGETCPVLPGAARVQHVPFADPPALALGCQSEAAAMACYRRVRDEIRAFVDGLATEGSAGR